MAAELKPIVELQPRSNAQVHANPLINRVLINRGIESIAEMQYSLARLIEPFALQNMHEAVEVYEKHLRLQSRVVVIGDFDCDGATSSAIAVEGFRTLGFKDVHFLIPDRSIHGYGLTPSIVMLAGELEPDLIVTVDSGIANLDGADTVKSLSHPCELVITDHHLVSDKGLPDAAAIVNPNMPTCTFPSKNLAGCGVMFYNIMALRSHLRRVGYFEEMGVTEPSILPLIDLVALGTVADVVTLDYNNRILVKAGLERIRAGKARPGIMALLDIAKKDYTKVVAQDFGFAVGPRINAAGRLEDMTIGVNCLLTQDHYEAQLLAARLDELNKARRDIEADHVIDANLLIEKYGLMSVKGAVLHDPTWHPGVVGIVASRIKEKMNRPVICMTDTPAAEEARAKLMQLVMANAPQEQITEAEIKLGNCDIKGSARSHIKVHLKHLLDKMYKRHPDLLSKFGGHAMAAGLALPYKNLLRFMSEFNGLVSAELTDEDLLGSIDVDMRNLDPKYMTLETAHEIRDMGPWGQNFTEPVFHAQLQMAEEARILSGKHFKMKVHVVGHPDAVFDAIAFGCCNGEETPVSKAAGTQFEASFALDINLFRGVETLQLMVRQLQAPEFVNTTLEMEQTVEKVAKPVKTPANVPDEKVSDAPDPVRPQSTKVLGLAKREMSNPVAQLREDMQSVIQQIKANAEKPKRTINIGDGAAPF
ncbi:single-stranded-DNA-specific exonuclease RecJ [Pseudomonas sp. PLMAX]|jgi:single-stranded-DNA-specific exonuclease|uniref:single-stranded-DNA-specific exonuclease RecJ n=1 Tax=Pseudomonas sp. PLMAX TaxID=2201998 RepID=UPI0038BAEA8F